MHVDDPVTEEVEMGNKAYLLEEKCVLVDDDGKPLETVDYSGGEGSEDEIESFDNEMSSYLALKPSRVGYGIKSLLEQWRET
ncbi:hypothetical protein Tco_0608262 [Tanacetum coccineum]